MGKTLYEINTTMVKLDGKNII